MYEKVITALFKKLYRKGKEVLPFSSGDLRAICQKLGVSPANAPDILYPGFPG